VGFSVAQCEKFAVQRISPSSVVLKTVAALFAW
jgi:hypothetical protein